MFSFIKGLFSSNSGDVMKVASGVGNWIDEQQFTEEEKSVANMKMLDHKLKWVAATQGMNLARRYIAMMFCLTFLLSFIACVSSVIIGFWLDVEVSKLVDSITRLVESFNIGWVVMTIIVFYFGKGIAENIKK